MAPKNNRGLRLELKGNKLIIDGEVRVNLKKVLLFLLIVLCVLLLIGSTLSESIRNAVLEALLSLLQLMLVQKLKRL